jgi:hypothetical protein
LGFPNWSYETSRLFPAPLPGIEEEEAPISTRRRQLFFWHHCWGERGFLQGESLTSNLFYFVIVLLSLFTLFCLLLVYQKHTKN